MAVVVVVGIINMVHPYNGNPAATENHDVDMCLSNWENISGYIVQWKKKSRKERESKLWKSIPQNVNNGYF